jgi:acyl dehydratase
MAYSSFHLAFDDLAVGQEWESAGRTVTESDIVTFAGFSGDFNPIHMDHEYAKTTPFRRPIAHGFGVFSLASGLGVSTPPTRIIALMGVRDWTFRLPVYAGDTVRVRTRVAELTPRGRGKRGEVVWYRALVNQDGKVVQDGHLVTLVECRPVRSAELGVRSSEPQADPATPVS